MCVDFIFHQENDKGINIRSVSIDRRGDWAPSDPFVEITENGNKVDRNVYIYIYIIILMMSDGE